MGEGAQMQKVRAIHVIFAIGLICATVASFWCYKTSLNIVFFLVCYGIGSLIKYWMDEFL